MLRSLAARALWLTRGAALFGGAVVTLALLLGVVTIAAAAVPGDPFRLGQPNRVNELTALASTLAGPVLRVDNDGSGTALDLRVGDSGADPTKKNTAPMKVDSAAKVSLLNADRLDGKSVGRIGVNGLRVVRSQSDTDEAAPFRRATAYCPNARDNLVVVGTGYKLTGAPYQNGSAVVTQVGTIAPRDEPDHPNAVTVRAVETEPIDGNWGVEAEAICATDGTPIKLP